MADLARLVDDLSALSVIEAAQLLEDARREMGRLGGGTGRGGGGRRRRPRLRPKRR